MRLLIFAVFALVFTAVLVGTHIYLYRRLIRDTTQAPSWQRRGKTAFIILGATLLIGVPAVRFFALPGEQYVGLVAFGWMGLVAISVAIFLCADLVRLIVARSPSTESGRES